MSRRRRFTLVWVSKYGRAVELGGPVIWCSVAVLAFLATVVAWSLGSTYGTSLFRSGQLTAVEQENVRLSAQLRELNDRMAAYQGRLDELVFSDQTIRIVTGIPDIHPDVRRAGVGGPPDTVGWSEGVGAHGALMTATRDSLDRLHRIVSLGMASLQEIQEKVQAEKMYWRHIPTIRPLIGPTASPYGMRKDPFTGYNRMHRGHDIAGRPDAPVKATADGVISRTGIDIKYGKYMDIDHGNGYLTRYAHLSAIARKKNDMITRGDIIGYVGNTGRATGFHVHYEVILKRRRLDPTDYFFPEDKSID